jgi:hypothetical protein
MNVMKKKKQNVSVKINCKGKNMYPISVKKNNYIKNKKNSMVLTPLWLSKFIYNLISKNIFNLILDIGCNNGSLSYFFRKKHTVCGIDIFDEYNLSKLFGFYYFKKDFLNLKKEKWNIKPDLILCNPPFNDSTGKYKKKLLPELFFKKIIEIFGYKIPFVLFVPMGFRLNQKKSSTRYKYIRDCGAELTSIISLPIDTYDNVLFHSEILIFNIFNLKSHYFIERSIKNEEKIY